MQGLLDAPSRFYALVLSPTRELALQIKEQIEALGAGISVKCAALVGGIDMVSQVRQAARQEDAEREGEREEEREREAGAGLRAGERAWMCGSREERMSKGKSRGAVLRA